MIDWYRSLTVVVVVGMFDFHSCSVPAAGPSPYLLDAADVIRTTGILYSDNDKTKYAAVASRPKVTATTTTTATAGTIGTVSTKAKTTTIIIQLLYAADRWTLSSDDHSYRAHFLQRVFGVCHTSSHAHAGRTHSFVMCRRRRRFARHRGVDVNINYNDGGVSSVTGVYRAIIIYRKIVHIVYC